MRILILDDHPQVLRTLEKMCVSLGQTVICVSTLDIARRFIDGVEGIDLIISDTNLADGRCGWEMAEVWKHKGIPFVGMSSDDVEEVWIEKGAMKFMQKPIGLSELRQCIDWIDIRSLPPVIK